MIERYLDFAPRLHPEAWHHPTALLMGDVELGRGASAWPYVVLRGDQGSIHIGEDSNLQDHVVAHGTEGISITVVGARVTVGHRAILHGCRVGDDCLVGMGSILLDNCEIGHGSVVGAGTVVPVGAKIPPNSLVLGVPGKVVRATTDADRQRIETGWRTYRRLAESYR